MTNKTLSKGAHDFIDDAAIIDLTRDSKEDKGRVRDIIAKSMSKVPLSIEEVADLIAADSEESTQELFNAARELKQKVYGNRIVIFAPLYIGNKCINDCTYCAFRSSLESTVRKTLNKKELEQQVLALEQAGHKRLILVFGEHPDYTPEYMAETVNQVYKVKEGNGEIRRVNINAAPMDHDGYKILKQAGIGTYQIFQKTYHHKTYNEVHPPRHARGIMNTV